MSFCHDCPGPFWLLFSDLSTPGSQVLSLVVDDMLSPAPLPILNQVSSQLSKLAVTSVKFLVRAPGVRRPLSGPLEMS